MRVQIDMDEVWPVYSITEPYRNDVAIIDIPDEFLLEYQETQTKYEAMQEKLKEYHEQAEKIHASKNAVRPPMHEGIECVYGAPYSFKGTRPSSTRR